MPQRSKQRVSSAWTEVVDLQVLGSQGTPVSLFGTICRSLPRAAAETAQLDQQPTAAMLDTQQLRLGMLQPAAEILEDDLENVAVATNGMTDRDDWDSLGVPLHIPLEEAACGAEEAGL